MNDYRSGFVSIVGCPNVGKSTLLNKLIGQKIAIVTDRAQTTRNKITGVLSRPGYQIVFLDTPGVTNPKNKLAIRESLENGNDGACWLSLVWYDNTDKLYHAELVYQFYNVKASQTTERANLDAYTQSKTTIVKL